MINKKTAGIRFETNILTFISYFISIIPGNEQFLTELFHHHFAWVNAKRMKQKPGRKLSWKKRNVKIETMIDWMNTGKKHTDWMPAP